MRTTRFFPRRNVLLCVIVLLFPLMRAKAAEAPPAIKAVTVPHRKIPEPEAREKKYPVPPTKWKRDPVLWGWTCELPDGSGLAFGGVHQTSEDGRPHTRLLVNGKWTPIVELLM